MLNNITICYVLLFSERKIENMFKTRKKKVEEQRLVYRGGTMNLSGFLDFFHINLPPNVFPCKIVSLVFSQTKFI